MHVFLDIDNFKQVNDRFGHHIGDLLIQKVSERLEQVRKGRQVLARVAGDEFAFLHPHDGQEDTDAVLQSLSKAFDRPFDLQGRVVYVTVSIGVSAYPQDATALQDLWVNSDLAMYEAKTRGRNRLVLYATILRERKIEEARIAQVLQTAIKARAFSIVLQPQVRLDGSGHLDGAEALLRCTDPELKDLGPGAYLPVAEHAGLMRGLDLIVADLVGEAVSRLRAEGFALRVSMNLSPDSLQQMSFGQDLFSHLEVANLGPTDVRFELTEGALVDLSSHARETLDLMHNRGFELSADDFGTGYSSLSYLHRLRLTEIKIDRSFVQRLGSSEEPSDEIVRAILAMGQALSLCVVAEGIETEAQVDWLSEHGCTLGQGYYFGRGLDIDAFLDQLRKPFLSKVTALSGLQSDVGQ
jgi:diguanylate cyclase (GGDEF)-like protein